jgi:hypothetical protein
MVLHTILLRAIPVAESAAVTFTGPHGDGDHSEGPCEELFSRLIHISNQDQPLRLVSLRRATSNVDLLHDMDGLPVLIAHRERTSSCHTF